MPEDLPTNSTPGSILTPAPKKEEPPVDPETEAVVDDIVKQEADDLLSAKDEEIQKAFEPPRTRWQRVKQWVRDVWAQPKWRYGIIATLCVVILTLFIVPVTRYGVLNAFGLRGKVSVHVLDEKTSRPLKNVTVELDGKSAKTDSSGTAAIAKVHLGRKTLHIKKIAYAETTQLITVKLGATDVGEKKLVAVGARLQFKVLDWVSKKPIANAEAGIDEASAIADDQGLIELAVAASDNAEVKVQIGLDHYKTKTVDANLADRSVQEVELSLDYPHYFVSKRSGKDDLYRVDLDGTNEKQVLAGTGSEQEDRLQLVPSHDHKYVAFVSRRDTAKNSDGYQLSTLNLIATQDDTIKKVAASEDIGIVGWDDDHLIFMQIAAGASAANQQRYRLVSYELSTGKSRDLASSNYFVGAQMIKGYVYYVPSDGYRDIKQAVYRAKSDGTDKITIYDNDVFSLFRTGYDQVTFQTADKWYRYTYGEGNPQKLDTAPANLKSIDYVETDSYKRVLWRDDRDGKGTLLVRDTDSKQDAVVVQQAGLNKALGWEGDDHATYRVVGPSETADYVASLSGGSPHKIRDVVDVMLTRPYY